MSEGTRIEETVGQGEHGTQRWSADRAAGGQKLRDAQACAATRGPIEETGDQVSDDTHRDVVSPGGGGQAQVVTQWVRASTATNEEHADQFSFGNHGGPVGVGGGGQDRLDAHGYDASTAPIEEGLSPSLHEPAPGARDLPAPRTEMPSARESIENGDGHRRSDTQFLYAVSGEGVANYEMEPTLSMPYPHHDLPPEFFTRLRELHMQHQDIHRAEKTMTLRIKAKCRRALGGDKGEAGKLYKAIMGKGEHPLAANLFAQCEPLLQARATLEAPRKKCVRDMEKMAKQLPVWDAWAKGVKGFGPHSLAQLIAETGDLSLYSNPAKVWKRMGEAVMPDGTRQRRVAGIDAIEHGYSPSRHSIAYVIGENILRMQGSKIDEETGEFLKEPGPYGAIYYARKDHEEGREGIQSQKHLHNRAMRYMRKRLLRDLWRAWRRCGDAA